MKLSYESWCVLLFLYFCEVFSVRRYATKTSYDASLELEEVFNGDDVGGICFPVHVAGLFRHGTRYPGKADVIGAREVLERIRGPNGHPSLQRDLLDRLNASLDRFNLSDCKLLAERGRQEHREIGERFARKYFQLLENVTVADVTWLSSYKSRAVDSCLAFQRGLVGSGEEGIRESVEVRDDLLRYFDNCDNYIEKVVRNKTSLAEVKAFQKLTYGAIVERLSKLLPVKNHTISGDEMKALYTIAASELAVHRGSTWDALFTEEDLSLLEYATDIKNYWKKGYGYSINYEQACILLKDMFTRMDEFIAGSNKKRGVFYFGHTETVVPILTLLGLFRDPLPLNADNFAANSQRMFRTSRIAPFATNVAFVLQDCSAGLGGEGSESAERFVLQLLFKEREIAWPACDGFSGCSYSRVRKYYAAYIDGCQFDKMCDNRKSVVRGGTREEL